MAPPKWMPPALPFVTILCFVSCFGLAAISGRFEARGIEQKQDDQHLRGRERKLQSETSYRVGLVLAIEYLTDTDASQIESSETIPSTDAAIHFCKSVNEQVRCCYLACSRSAL